MKKKFYKKYIKYFVFILIFVGMVFLAYNTSVFADVGNNNRYDSDSSSGDAEGIIYLIWIIFDLLGPVGRLILLVIIGIVFLWLKVTGRLKKIKVNSENDIIHEQVVNDIEVDNTNDVSKVIREIDPSFSSDKFIGWAREVFIKIQSAWTDRNWKSIRPFESETLFSQHNTQLEEYIRNNKINVVEKIGITHCSLKNFNVDGDKEVLVVLLSAVMRDYVIDSNTRKVLEGDPDKDWYMKYEMIFNRKRGIKTKVGLSNKSTTNCPNCGAPTEITSAGQCEYCGSVITNGEHDWVLTDIHSIK